MGEFAGTAQRVRRQLRVTGQVQGVGFRPHLYRLATELKLAGTVRNDSSGVLIQVEGSRTTLDLFMERLRTSAPALADVGEVTVIEEGPPAGDVGFSIEESAGSSSARSRVTIDTATCPSCLRELRDPADRRFHHAFVNCVSCGPRYTIVTDLPYDRPNTTMA
ncbi:MAG: acylphosphatase, partial [Planctomycetota bacterium]